MKKLTEEDIKLRHITPAIEKAGWDKEKILMEYFFTDGQVLVRGNTVKRGKRKKADYILTYNGQLPLAIVEAKDADHSVGSGMQQAIEYAMILNVPFAYSSNGSGFIEHDFFTGSEREFTLDEFPCETELWNRYTKSKGFNESTNKEQQKKLLHMLISEITINEQREIDSIKLKINDSLVNYMNKEEGVSIAGTPSSFSLKNIGLSTIDLDIAI